ncbi:MAG: DUF4131 domain-containing protein [Inquilinus sp.]|nr:DUF4131 domain-containing protein [Inquilinus sp.]
MLEPVLAAAIGFAAAQWQTARMAAPMLAAPLGPTWVEGRVVSLSRLPEGVRVVLADPVVRGLDPAETPRRVRLRLPRRTEPPPTGAVIGVRAFLNPPSRPVAPGAFDFRRHSYFRGIGAIGYAVSRATVVEPGAGGGLSLRLESLRRGIAGRIAESLDGDRASVATALLIGDRGGLRPPVYAAIREAGLAHLLAISGLHLGLVAGLIFFATRAGLALVPPLALGWPIKKWAAVAALLGGFAYMLIAGATVPTQRAFAMTALVLLAVLVDRTALSMRLVAWAAALVLAVAPHSLLGPSFQMSFAAVIALIAGYEALRDRLAGWREGAGWGRRGLLYLGGVLLSTAIASTATAPFAVYHFQQYASYGLATNLIAVPLTALWIMPCGLLAFLLMPVGLESLGLVPMGWGIEILIRIAETAAAWPNASLHLRAPPDAALGVTALGGLWLCLWRGVWRHAGWAGLAIGLALAAGPRPQPDILVNETGSLMAVRDRSSRLLLSSHRGDRFVAEMWLRREGQGKAEEWPPAGRDAAVDLSCDPLGCLYRRDGQLIALVRDARALTEDCPVADAVVANVPVPSFCGAALVVDRFDLWRHGAHALFIERDGTIRVERVANLTGDRPWAIRR